MDDIFRLRSLEPLAGVAPASHLRESGALCRGERLLEKPAGSSYSYAAMGSHECKFAIQPPELEGIGDASYSAPVSRLEAGPVRAQDMATCCVKQTLRQSLAVVFSFYVLRSCPNSTQFATEPLLADRTSVIAPSTGIGVRNWHEGALQVILRFANAMTIRHTFHN
ncbi:MAG: hypothetical protein ACYC9L_12375 [Sulfuricaulis sp.]